MSSTPCNKNIKYFHKFIPPIIWLIIKTWVNFLMDDFEEY